MDETNNDLYPVQLKDPEVPIQEDCTSDVLPEGTTNMEGKKKVLVPELITMTKYLFDNYAFPVFPVFRLDRSCLVPIDKQLYGHL